jgi:hypothetical protein
MTERRRQGTDPSAGGAPARRPLGQLALEAGLITNEQLASAIADIQSNGRKLGEVLIGRGLMEEPQLAQLLELQERGGAVPRLGTQPVEGEETAAATAGAGDTAARRNGAKRQRSKPGSGQQADQIIAAVRRDMVDLLFEVEQRTAAAGELIARNAELREKLAETSAVAEAQERELSVARREVQRLTQLVEQRDAREAALRGMLDQLTRQLAAAGDR